MSGYLLHSSLQCCSSSQKMQFFPNLGFWCSLDSRLSPVECFMFVSYGLVCLRLEVLMNHQVFETTLPEDHQLLEHWYVSSATFGRFPLSVLHLQVSFLQVSATSSVEISIASLRELAVDYHLAQENVNIASVFRSYCKMISVKLIWMLPLVDLSILRSGH